MLNRDIKKMLSITNHQGNVNQNHNVLSPHPSNIRKTSNTIDMDENIIAIMENNMDIPQEIKNKTTI
jgi:hypothetical protein